MISHGIEHLLHQPDSVGPLVAGVLWEDGSRRPYIIRTGIAFVVTTISGENRGARFEGKLGIPPGT